ncbi:Zinc knuckle CX2CX4HX4C [Sesbania bispinosa]|nr:Zinc knuckle CX2CX4HX4C [Sesbania bispinosa]
MEKKFQFLFDEEKDVERVLRGSPWIFRNAWLLLKRWERGQEIESLNFSIVPLKIQIWGLPLHCRTTRMGSKIGACMGEVVDAEAFATKEKGSFIKVKVNFDTTQPPKPGVNVGSRANGVTWVDFRYERLPQFRYSCGLVGHEESGCVSTQRKDDEQEESFLGPWLRASQIGRKIQLQDHGQYEKAHSRRQQEKKENLSNELLHMLSALTVNKDNPSSKETPEPEPMAAKIAPLNKVSKGDLENNGKGVEKEDSASYRGMDANLSAPCSLIGNNNKENFPQPELNQLERSPLKCISNTPKNTEKWKRIESVDRCKQQIHLAKGGMEGGKRKMEIDGLAASSNDDLPNKKFCTHDTLSAGLET